MFQSTCPTCQSSYEDAVRRPWDQRKRELFRLHLLRKHGAALDDALDRIDDAIGCAHPPGRREETRREADRLARKLGM